jgi:hypothetical protein
MSKNLKPWAFTWIYEAV